MMTLKEKAYIELRRLILEGEIKGGEFLSERTLIDVLNMSRTPIRSAIERLVVEGFVNYSPNKGLFVSEMSIDKAIDIYDIRMALETYVVKRLANQQLSIEEKEWFENNLTEQKKSMDENNLTEFTELDSQFHRKLAAIYENKEIIQVMEQIQDKLYLIAHRVLKKDSSRIEVSYNDHCKIYENIISGNGEEAAKEVVQHLEYGKLILIS